MKKIDLNDITDRLEEIKSDIYVISKNITLLNKYLENISINNVNLSCSTEYCALGNIIEKSILYVDKDLEKVIKDLYNK